MGISISKENFDRIEPRMGVNWLNHSEAWPPVKFKFRYTRQKENRENLAIVAVELGYRTDDNEFFMWESDLLNISQNINEDFSFREKKSVGYKDTLLMGKRSGERLPYLIAV